jgi:hypothetical protein
VSVLLTALAVAAGAAAAKVVSVLVDRRRAARGLPASSTAQEPTDTESDKEIRVAQPQPKKDAGALLRAFPCKLGDVVTSPMFGEAWLAGCVVLSEGTPVRAVFVAPEALADRYVVAKPEPDPGIYLTQKLPELAKALGHEPPMSLEHETTHYLRKRRLPLRCTRLGASPPALGDTLVYAEYEPAGAEGALFVLLGTEQTMVLHGTRLAPGMFDVYPGAEPEDSQL